VARVLRGRACARFQDRREDRSFADVPNNVRERATIAASLCSAHSLTTAIVSVFQTRITAIVYEPI
jgi:hypothetical protein